MGLLGSRYTPGASLPNVAYQIQLPSKTPIVAVGAAVVAYKTEVDFPSEQGMFTG